MTPQQVTLVQDSFAKVRPIADTAADLFYGRLFEIAPGVRAMFPEDMREQKKKLMAMLGLAVTNLHKPDTVVPALQTLGRQHVAFGTQAAHYAPVGEALLWTLEQGLGPDFTPEVREAWTETYGLVARVMQDAAADMRA
ncbi:globin family protein [Methylobacterium goesingense]|uniref:Hemoglobin-like flavoprotein n=1 Tax=Methylobacterium goesingense TaxID=243690 RepID=A0ABV2KZ92_9HYPH|nr:globin family protein [Methylobacterium goesingense]GJD75530.1 Bacterial hemoglobin [Methylobacterium goesingense]